MESGLKPNETGTDPTRIFRTNWISYSSLFAVQAVGGVLILWKGIPFYREVLVAKREAQAPIESVVVVGIGAVLIMAGYCTIQRRHKALAAKRSEWLGRGAQFLGRLNFVFVSSTFSTTMFLHLPDADVVWWRLPVLVAALFAMFCLTLEFERLGKALVEGERHVR
jgi:drug/metabolite transporter (DMT)-like permease